MSRSRGVIRAITVSSSSKCRAPFGGGTTGRKGKKYRKMGEKRHFEPVKRAEPRFPENPTNHSSPPARRRQKNHAPPSFIPTPPPFSPAPPSSDLIRSLRLPHTLAILPHPPLSCRHRSNDVKHRRPPFKPVHIPRPFILCPTHGAALPYTTPTPFIPLSCGCATTIRSI